MSKLLIRTLSGFAFAVLTIASILYNQFSISTYLFILMLICLFEFKRLIHLKSFWIYINTALIYINFAIHYWVDIDLNSILINIAAYGLTFGLVAQLINILFLKKEEKLGELKKAGLALIYIAIPFSIGLGLGFVQYPNQSYSPTFLLALFFLLWSNDSFAYLIGKNIGKTPLAPKISPKKTVEGFVGGVISTILMATILSFFDQSIGAFEWTFLAIIISVSGVVGDLVESFFKRKAAVKDSGNIMPGHGGFLDRLDSFIFAAPLAYVYLTLIL